MIAPGPGHYVVGRTTKVARAQARENVGATRREVEPTGIEPVTSCLQSRCADAGWRRLTLTGAGSGQFNAGSRRLARARNVTSS
jgi:hypothetical protein